MKEDLNPFSLEAINKLIAPRSGELSPEDSRLVQDLSTLARSSAQEDERSLERIWARFAQGQEPAYSPQETSQHPGSSERKDMQQNETQWGPTLASHAGKTPRRSPWRILNISLVAVVALVAIVGWVFFSSGLKLVSHPGGQTQTGSAKTYTSGQLLCHFVDDTNAQNVPIGAQDGNAQPSLDWSPGGQLAVTFSSLGVFDGTTCAQSLHTNSQSYNALWSPDHTRLLNESLTGSLQVLDGGTGKILTTYVPGGIGYGPAVWSPDGTSIMLMIDDSLHQWRAITWSASTGTTMSTLLTVTNGYTIGSMRSFSPDGKYIVESAPHGTEIWNVSTKTLVSTLPVNTADQNALLALAWSPDDASLALATPNGGKVQIWSVASGKQTASFTDESHAANLGALAWSPDGKYLAESATEINLWDVHTQKIVATFGKAPAGKWVNTLAWSKDSSKLASTLTNTDRNWTQNTVNLWKLS